jgi:hypothetical protein
MVDEMWLLVVPRGRARFAAVQIWFAGGKRHRDYLILHQSPLGNRHKTLPGGWWVRSLADVTKLGVLDLRRHDHVLQLEKLLQSIDVDELRDALEG